MDIEIVIKNANDALSIAEKLYLESQGTLKQELKILMSKMIFVSGSLEEIGTKTPERIKKKRRKVNNKRNVYVVACYLSKFGHSNLFKEHSQQQAFKEISRLLDVNTNTLKASRDEFDSFFPNNRSGWKSGSLKPPAQEVYNEYKDLNHDEFVIKVKDIIKID